MRHLRLAMLFVSILCANSFALLTINGAVGTQTVAANEDIVVEATGDINGVAAGAISFTGGSAWTLDIATGGQVRNNSATATIADTVALNDTTLNISGTGTISNGTGSAIDMANGDDIVTLNIGINITSGQVSGGSHNVADTLNLAGATGTGTIGVNLANFEIINKTGAGTWNLNGTTGFDSAFNINAGSIAVGAAGTLDGNAGGGGPGNLVLASGTSLTLTGIGQNIATMTINGATFSKDGGTAFTATNTTMTTGSIDVTSTGGAVNFGITDIGAGTFTVNQTGGTATTNGLTIGGGTATISSAMTDQGDIAMTGGTMTVGSTLTNNDAGAGNGDLTINSGASVLVTAAGTLNNTRNVNIGSTGAGTMTVTGAATVGGATTIADSGLLAVNGTYAGGNAIAVNSGGILGGSGAITHDITVANGGTVKPGSSIGTMSVTGAYVHQAGSTLEIEVGNSGADQVDVTGAATLAGTLDVKQQAGSTIAGGTQYTIIKTTGGIGGAFGTVTDNSSILNFSTSVSGNDLLLTAIRNEYSSFVTGGKATAVAKAIQPVANTATGDMATIINTLDGITDSTQLTGAMEQLNAESHSHYNQVAMETTQVFTGAMASHFRAARAGESDAMFTPYYAMTQGPQFAWNMDSYNDWAMAMQSVGAVNTSKTAANSWGDENKSVFGRFLAYWGDEETTADRTGFGYDGFGGIVGIEEKISDTFVAGWTFAYLRTEIGMDQDRGHETVDQYRVGPHFTKDFENFYVDLSATYGFGWHEGQRNINIPGLVRQAYNQHDSHDATIYGGIGMDIPRGRFTLSPQASLQYQYLYIDGYTETGAGAANLRMDSVSTNSLRSTLGGRVSFQPYDEKPQCVYSVWGGWAHEYMGDDNDTKARLTGGGNAFAIEGSTSDRDSYYFGGGIKTPIRENLSAFFAYNGEFNDKSENHTLSVSLRLLF